MSSTRRFVCELTPNDSAGTADATVVFPFVLDWVYVRCPTDYTGVIRIWPGGVAQLPAVDWKTNTATRRIGSLPLASGTQPEYDMYVPGPINAVVLRAVSGALPNMYFEGPQASPMSHATGVVLETAGGHTDPARFRDNS